LPYRIVWGDERFAEHATSGQGISWRCSTAAFLDNAATTIDALDTVAARQAFSIAEMFELGVYKVRPSDNDEEAFDRVLENLRSLARHYHQIARRGLDLIIEIW
jgi:hypothetical protein